MRKIRIFKYDRDTEIYMYEDYRGTAVVEEGTVTEDGGSRRYCQGSVRLMTAADIDVKPGDYVSLYEEERLDKNRDFLIT